MGASEFMTTVRAKTPAEAFKLAHDNAQYESGHGGYSGTAAEKHDFKFYAVPAGAREKTIRIFARAVTQYEDDLLVVRDQLEGEEEWAKAAAKRLRHAKTKWAKYPLAQAARTWRDKWGPAVVLRLAKDLYLVFGLASD